MRIQLGTKYKRIYDTISRLLSDAAATPLYLPFPSPLPYLLNVSQFLNNTRFVRVANCLAAAAGVA